MAATDREPGGLAQGSEVSTDVLQQHHPPCSWSAAAPQNRSSRKTPAPRRPRLRRSAASAAAAAAAASPCLRHQPLAGPPGSSASRFGRSLLPPVVCGRTQGPSACRRPPPARLRHPGAAGSPWLRHKRPAIAPRHRCEALPVSRGREQGAIAVQGLQRAAAAHGTEQVPGPGTSLRTHIGLLCAPQQGRRREATSRFERLASGALLHL